jgi:hypothetical protein
MSKLAKKYDGPKLHIIVKRADTGGTVQYKWRISMVDSDWRRTGTRMLAYRASGFVAGDKVVFESEPEVHDENRDVWTTMNLTDRPDIRKTIRSKVLLAQKKIEESGEDGFDFRLD